LYQVKQLKCKYYATISRTFGSTFNNKRIVTKAGSESVQSYITRIAGTICGKHVHGDKGKKSAPGGWGGGLERGMLDQYLKAKDACEIATRTYNDKVRECKRKIHEYNVRKAKCNQFQTLMDSRSCKHAVLVKDTCEQYASCYITRLQSFETAKAAVKMEERDRKAEWRGLTRIACLIAAFSDGKMTDKEVDECKARVVTTDHLIIKYPKVPPMTKCVVTRLYPSTGAYKRAEFASLPALAKGKVSVPCSGVEEIPTKPRKGSPKSCKCRRVTLEGHYSAGPLVKCTNCHDIRRSLDKSSCPRGTKLFSPGSRSDWRTFLSSTGPLAHPHFIVDITRPQSGCGGCTSNAMNSQNANQKSWRTADGSHWWLRSTKYKEPSGDYAANCFLGLSKVKPVNENSVTFNDHQCNYHSKSYYCQKVKILLTPKKGSPSSCRCTPVTLASKYSAGMLVKCEQCLSVSRSQQKNSCPKGMKIFSPRSRADWKTFVISAQPLRAPHWIIDVTRPQNGCGGCGKYPMNSGVPNQATWRTSDGSPWWLRSSRYNQPSGDYTANCFMDLWRVPSSENTIQFNDKKCSYRSRSYYCQPIMRKGKKAPPPPAGINDKRLVPNSQLLPGLLEEIYYFEQGDKIPSLQMKRRTPTALKVAPTISYGKSMSFKGFPNGPDGKPRTTHMSVRWTGFLIAPKTALYKFDLYTYGGSKLWIDNKEWININNRPRLGRRSKASRTQKLQKGQHYLRIEYFKKDAGPKGAPYPSGCIFKYNIAGIGKKMSARMYTVPRKMLMYRPAQGLKEEIFTGIKGMKKVPDLNKPTPAMDKVVNTINFPSNKGAWIGHPAKDNYAARFSGFLQITQKGTYRFSLASDDGSRLFIGNSLVIDNDGLHGLRKREATRQLTTKSYRVIVEFFENGGHAALQFKYMGPDTQNRMVVVPKNKLKPLYGKTSTPKVAAPKKKSLKKKLAGKLR